jgi:hypothetical protein
MKHNQAGILGMEINKFCFNNQATFGNGAEYDITPIPYWDVYRNDGEFAVRVKKIVRDEDCLNKLNSFCQMKRKQEKSIFKIDDKESFYVIHDQKSSRA